MKNHWFWREYKQGKTVKGLSVFAVGFFVIFIALSPLGNIALAQVFDDTKKGDTPTFPTSSTASATTIDEADKKNDITNFPPNFCQMDVVSDTTNTLPDGSPAVATYVITRESSDGVHWWTANIPGATWIWKSFYVQDSTVEDTATITKTFNVPQEISFASLSIAADNTYQVFVNGTKAYENPTEFNYFEENKGLVDIAPYLHTGSNTLSFIVKNLAQASSTPQSNPAGLLYALKITMKGPCGTPPPPTPIAPTVSLTANPNTIFTGATSTLSWVSNNATSCSASWTNATSTSGSQIVTPPNTTDYSITCVGAGGTTVASVRVTVNPIIISGCANGTELTFAEFNAAVSSQKIDYNLTVNTGNKTSTFTMNNRSGCLVPISFSVYKVFDSTLSHQKIFDGTGLIKATSTTVLSVMLPDCLAQIDAWYGLYPQTLEDSNPYAYPNVPGVITYKKTDLPFCTVSQINTPPTITLLGANPLDYTIGGIFTDPGATATDIEDGNLTSAIVSTSTVSTTTPGTYRIDYSVTDSGGLSASTSRSVIVSQPGCTSNCGGGGTTTPPTIPIDKACTIVSDTQTFVDGKATVFAYDQNPLWTVSIPGASWIWPTFKVVNPQATTTVIFEKRFFATSTSASAILNIAADDTYLVKLNGVQVAIGGSHEVSKEHNISSALVAGENVMTIEVSNIPIVGSTPESNPAGLIYKLNLTGNGCGTATNTPPTITLIGSNPLNYTIGGVFTDPGATATDTEDGNLTSAIVSSSTVSTTTAGTYQIKYSVTDSGGLSASTTRTVVVSAPTCTSNCGGGGSTSPTVFLNANPNTISPGATSTLSWVSTNATSCVSSWTIATSTSGSQIVSPATTTEYSIACSGSDKTASATTTITVTTPGQVVPTVTISADPQTISSGGSSVLAWTSTNTSFCSAPWTSATSTSGSQTVSPSATSEYSISCGGSFGTSTATTTVTVRQPENNGGGGGGGGGGSSSSGGGGGIGGHRRPIPLASGGGEVLGVSSCLYLRDFLRIDWNNDPVEMLKLKSFLNVFEKENLSLTDVFDQATYDAVSRFQNKYFNDILEPWGHKAPTGFVYILTKKKVNEIYCNNVIYLTQAERDEISTFRAYMDSIAVLSGIQDANYGSPVGSGDAVLSGVVGGADIESPFIIDLKDNATSTEDANDSVIKNVAVSLFALPQKLIDNKMYLFFFLAAIVFLIFLIMYPSGTSKIHNPELANISINKKVSSGESPVIILPGAKSDLPDEEIIIDNEEEEINIPSNK